MNENAINSVAEETMEAIAESGAVDTVAKEAAKATCNMNITTADKVIGGSIIGLAVVGVTFLGYHGYKLAKKGVAKIKSKVAEAKAAQEEIPVATEVEEILPEEEEVKVKKTSSKK